MRLYAQYRNRRALMHYYKWWQQPYSSQPPQLYEVEKIGDVALSIRRII